MGPQCNSKNRTQKGQRHAEHARLANKNRSTVSDRVRTALYRYCSVIVRSLDEIRARYFSSFIALNEWKSHLWENKSVAVHYVTTNIVKQGSRRGERISSLPAWLARPIPFIATYDAISGSCIVETFCPQTRISTSTRSTTCRLGCSFRRYPNPKHEIGP